MDSSLTKKRKTNTVQTLAALKHLLTALAQKPMTQPEIAEATGLVNSTVSRWLKVLHNKPNLVYIERWQRRSDRGNWQAVWAFGYMQFDADRPQRMSDAEYRRRWLRKRNQNG